MQTALELQQANPPVMCSAHFNCTELPMQRAGLNLDAKLQCHHPSMARQSLPCSMESQGSDPATQGELNLEGCSPWAAHTEPCWGVLTCAGSRGGVLHCPVEAAVTAAHAGCPALRMAVWGALGTQLVPRVRLVEAQLACCWEEGAVVRRCAKSAQEHHPQEHSGLHAPGLYNKATSFLFQGKKNISSHFMSQQRDFACIQPALCRGTARLGEVCLVTQPSLLCTITQFVPKSLPPKGHQNIEWECQRCKGRKIWWRAVILSPSQH